MERGILLKSGGRKKLPGFSVYHIAKQRKEGSYEKEIFSNPIISGNDSLSAAHLGNGRGAANS